MLRLGPSLIAVATAFAMQPLPNVPSHARARPGWSLSHFKTSPAQSIDFFLGPFCEDSRRIWPTLEALAASRGAKTDVRFHWFPLPYNMLSWLPAQACTAAAQLSSRPDAVVAAECATLLYEGDNQRTVKTLAMVNGTVPDVINALVSLVSKPLGVEAATLRANLQQGLESGSPSYSATKLGLKHGWSSGIFATPGVLLNSVQIFGYDDSGNGGSHAEGQLTSLSVQDWNLLLDLKP